uniref:Poly [ADP-ribose] polymerase 14-like n=1 Tax=Saccoglossus kowalevskii TaxID=10224 RepID=A0ABM0M7L8_SACKO
MMRVLENPTHVINNRRVKVQKAKMKDNENVQDDNDSNCTIEVSGCDPHTRLDTIGLYFDSKRRSGGGDVNECRQEGDKFIVVFEKRDSAVRVLKQPRHIIDDTTVVVKSVEQSESKTFANDEDVCSDEDPFEDCRLEVTGFNPDTSIDVLELYFESRRRSGGGSLINIDKDDPEKVTLTFESNEAKKQVLQRQHTIDNVTLTVKEPPKRKKLPKDKQCLLITGLADNTSKENIELFLESRTGIEGNSKILFGEEPDSHFQTIVQKVSERSLNGATLVVKAVTVTDSILILNLPENITKDTIEFYFENQKKSGGGDVEEVTLDHEKHVAVVYFEDYQVVKSVISRHHVINGVELDVHPYYECLGFTVSCDEPMPRIPQPLPYKVNPDIIKFIKNTDLEEFTNTMKQLYARVEWPHQDKTDVLLLTPDLPENTNNLHKITKSWMSDLENGLDKYLQSFKGVTIPVMEGIWLQVVAQLKRWSQDKDACMTMDQSSCTVFLTGKSDNVSELKSRIESVVKDIKDKMQKAKERTTEKIKVNTLQARQLQVCEYKNLVHDKLPDVDVEIILETETLSLEGLPHDIPKAKVLMYETLEGLSTTKMKPPNTLWLQYLKTSKVSKRLHDNFSSVKIDACYLLQDDEIVCSAIDKSTLDKAVNIIKTNIKELKIDIKPESEAALQQLEWKTMVSDLEQRKNVIISKEHNRVSIIGFETDADSVMSELNTFIQVHTIIEDFVEAENGKLRYISEYKKDDISKIQIESRVQPFKITPKYNGPVGFVFKGTENDVKTARVKVQKLIDVIYAHPYPVDKPGMPKLFKEEKGKNLIKLVENEINCKIDINHPSEIETKGAGEEAEKHFKEAALQPTLKIVCQHAIHGGRRIVVGKGDLTKMAVDVVVNSANTYMSYTGGLSKAIADAGGPAIHKACEAILRKQHGRLHPGQAVHTTSGKMPCKAIIHAVGPSSNKVNHQSGYSSVRDPYSQEENLLTDAVQNSLTLAEELGYSSIGIPAISSGTMGFSLDLCTNTIVSAVDDWAKNTPPGILLEIRLVDNSDNTCESFKHAMMKHFGEDNITPSSSGRDKRKTHGGRRNKARQQSGGIKTAQQNSSPKHVAPNTSSIRDDELPFSSRGIQVTSNPGEISIRDGKTVRLVKGSISSEKVDVIVNTTQPTFNLNTGAVSKSILQAAGTQLQQEINNKKTSGVSTNEGDGIVTSGGNMQCNNIYHVLCCGWDSNGSKASQVLRKIMQNCLNTAAQSGYKSIAFPAIGTGGLGFPRDVTAEIMYEEVIAYINDNPASSVSEIRFVVYDQDFATIQVCRQQPDTVVMTGAGNLKCNKILHMISPYTKLEDSVIKMLKFAEKHKLKSIAMPAVGAGAPQNVAREILNAIGEFVQQCDPQFLEVIRITIFQSSRVAIFNKEMKSMVDIPMKDTRGVFGKAWGAIKSLVGGSDNSTRVKMIDTIILHIYADRKNIIDDAITKINQL